MNNAKPVFFNQGLFLQPQHFQLIDSYFGSLIQPLQTYAQPYFWGVASLRIQEALLSTQQLEVTEGEFLFSDGSHIVFPGNAVIKPRSFDGAWLQAERPLTVYLGLRKWNPHGSNVTPVPSEDEMAGVTTRFATTADPEQIADLHAGGPPARVKRLTHVVRLFWENELEQMDHYALMPIAQLVRQGDQIALSKGFAPPSLTVAASSVLHKALKDIRDLVASRCRQLEEYKDPHSVQTMMLALFALNRHVPLLTQLCQTQTVHPFWVYTALGQLVGELSTFSRLVSANGERPDGTVALPGYSHANPGACFREARALLSELLDTILAGPEYAVRLKLDGIHYTGAVPQDFFDRHNRHWLVVQTERDDQEVVAAVTQVAKLGTAKTLAALVARAIPGIPLVHHPGVPPGLPQRANTHYFLIDTRSQLWADVVAEESISLYWDTAPEDLRAELIVLKE